MECRRKICNYISRIRRLVSFLCVFAVTITATSSLRPPVGNKLFLAVIGRGVQVYKCQQNQTQITSYLDHAEAFLYAGYDTNFSQAVGSHYFLPHPDGLGGKPTWAHFDAQQKAWSTVTGIIKGRIDRPGTIPDLLLQATSHSGLGDLKKVSYIRRSESSGGNPPCCNYVGQTTEVQYKAVYSFYERETSPPVKLPSALIVPESQVPVVSYFCQGVQMYSFNGTAWAFQTATCDLSSVPGQEVIGRHLYLPEQDDTVGQPTWETFMPQSTVTAKLQNTAVVDPDSIPWAYFQATNNSGGQHILGSVSYVLRVSTTNGESPNSIDGSKLGDTYASPYTAIYWFYATQ